MENALKLIREAYGKSNAQGRYQIQKQLYDLQNDLYTDWEVFFGAMMAPLRCCLIQIGIDLNIFTTISSSSKPITHQDLIDKTGASPTLLVHLLRAMASFGLVQEISVGTLTANRMTEVLSKPSTSGASTIISDLQLPVAQALPPYLKSHSYQNLTDVNDLPFQMALKTNLAPFEYMKQNPYLMEALGHIMVLDVVVHWVSSYPVVETIGPFKPSSDSALLVDIGGGFGQRSIAFKEKFPDLEGRIVVQDLESTLVHVPTPHPQGIEFQHHDFFTVQPIKGAKFYYLRSVLHDWPDDACVKILQSIVPAMGPDSLILIDEIVLPEEQVPWQVSSLVVCLMAGFGGIERTREEWDVLLGKAGLKIENVHLYDEDKFKSIITTVPQ